MTTNTITVKELWDDLTTGQYCAEISIDGRNVASVYSRDIERILLGAMVVDQHREVRRDVSFVLNALRRRVGV